ncbi:hypothetical protein D6T64_05660 [Cryobacterium melibiosiphilum]|uniref:Terminase n=1 Tax=Cryobacterium melibiosiphilum TaxID=995039 RepID=A0A3A5MLF5_9MICO|nr:hypothetical protein [Cryobacterium melibiosiphilum]RJT89821.1 hypothetical protein D6T64_05660 [Cryobacterium melibiosiphilum]
MVTGFDYAPITPAVAASRIYPWADWENLRDSHTPPHYVSAFTGAEEYRDEFLMGAHAFGLIDKDGSNSKLKPQQLVMADAANAVDADGRPLSPFLGVLIPRRSAKTTTALALVIGRCLARPNYLVAFTLCTSGLMARKRFHSDIVPVLEKAYPHEATRPFKFYKSGGSESINFTNGSRFVVVSPHGESFRSEAFDCVLVDEAGEASLTMGEDLLAGILPTLDTRPDSQVITCGTAGTFRTGQLLWDTLSDGRDGKPGSGIVEWSGPEYLTAEDVETWELTEPIVRAAHPGIDTLTTISAIERNYRKLPRDKFIREYLSIFEQVGATVGIIRPEKWAAAELNDDLPEPPAHFALAIAASPNQAYASIVAAWREDGEARILLLDHRSGVKWLAPRALELARKYKVPVAHDTVGVVLVEVEELQRAKPRPRLQPQTFRNVITAAALLIKEIDTGNLKHYGQTVLDEHAAIVKKRMTGKTSWAFGRTDYDDDISAVEAASLALRAYDGTPIRGKVMLITADS